MAARLAWGILGCGRIAAKFAKGLAESETGRLLAAASRTKEKAEEFRAGHGAERAYGSYEAMLDDPDVAAVYIATPHPMHAEWSIRAAEAGKHVLCEKPLALNHGEAMQVVEAARRCDVFLMEAFMYRCHPQTARLVKLVREGAVGEVRCIQASFAFKARFDPESRLFSGALGGGGILDVGCYPVSAARLVAGAAAGRDFADPLEIKAVGELAETGVDAWTVAVARFSGGLLAELATGVQVRMANDLRVFGSEGSIEIPQPWQPDLAGGGRILLTTGDGTREIVIDRPRGVYAFEADVVAANIERRQAPTPAMSWADSLGNMRALDAWRAAIGVEYDAEKPEGATRTATGRPLAVRPGSRMKYGEIPGGGKRVSRLVMGADNQRTMPHATAMFDDFFERGGNAFDTAYIYGGGLQERLLGAWVRSRGVRDQVVILEKGAHTPHCTPEGFRRQFAESLERMGLDYVDLYMLHRDNLEVPVAEFVDALDEEVRAGRIRALGASNWTIARVEEANAYAARKGLAGFAAVSNNLSLARMVEPPWAGCLSAKGDLAWFERTGTPLMPWSSQARGFFTGRARPTDRSAPGLARCWYAPDNFERLARAEELAERRGVPAIAVALAWVFCQRFPTFPLIGPRSIDETRGSLQALELELSPEEVRWLDLEGDA